MTCLALSLSLTTLQGSSWGQPLKHQQHHLPLGVPDVEFRFEWGSGGSATLATVLQAQPATPQAQLLRSDAAHSDMCIQPPQGLVSRPSALDLTEDVQCGSVKPGPLCALRTAGLHIRDDKQLDILELAGTRHPLCRVASTDKHQFEALEFSGCSKQNKPGQLDHDWMPVTADAGLLSSTTELGGLHLPGARCYPSFATQSWEDWTQLADSALLQEPRHFRNCRLC